MSPPDVMLWLLPFLFLATTTTATELEEVSLAAVAARMAREAGQGEEVALPVNLVDARGAHSINGSSRQLIDGILRNLQVRKKKLNFRSRFLCLPTLFSSQCLDQSHSDCSSPLSVSFFPSVSSATFWSGLKRRRMLWRGAVNLVLLPEEAEEARSVATNFLDRVRERFVTGEGGVIWL